MPPFLSVLLTALASVSAAPTAAGIAVATSDTELLINVPSQQQVDSNSQDVAACNSDGNAASDIGLGKHQVVDDAQVGDNLNVTNTAIYGNGRHARAVRLSFGLDGGADLKLSLGIDVRKR
ncbi:hypothetical protein DXG01_015051 [Tephrocybe rancida]|nr:hypothetical protein DXG01_015051 [Tephrocybe rancida]